MFVSDEIYSVCWLEQVGDDEDVCELCVVLYVRGRELQLFQFLVIWLGLTGNDEADFMNVFDRKEIDKIFRMLETLPIWRVTGGSIANLAAWVSTLDNKAGVEQQNIDDGFIAECIKKSEKPFSRKSFFIISACWVIGLIAAPHYPGSEGDQYLAGGVDDRPPAALPATPSL